MNYIYHTKINERLHEMEYLALFFTQASIDKMRAWIDKHDIHLNGKPILAPHITFKFGECPMIPLKLLDGSHEVEVVGYARKTDVNGDGKVEQGFENALPSNLLALYRGQEKIHTTMGLGAKGRAFLTGKLAFEPLQEPFAAQGYLGYWDRENKEVLIPTTNPDLHGTSVH